MKPAAPLPVVLLVKPRRGVRAFSLVVTLIIVSMLAVVAVGFLSSMSNERATADAFGNKSRAEQAAQAGVDSATAILRQAFKDFPDSATVWEPYNANADGSVTVDKNHPVTQYNEGTSLYVRAMPSAVEANQPNISTDIKDKSNNPGHTVSDANGADARSTFVLPLVSGAAYRQLDSKRTAVNAGNSFNPKDTDPVKGDSFVDLNVLRYKDDTQGWIGSPPVIDPASGVASAPVVPKTARVPWVEIKQPDAKDPSHAPVVARYAFWVEDESFRTNINFAGLGTASVTPAPPAPPPANGRRQDNNATFSNISPIPTPNLTPTPAPDLPLNAGSSDLYGLFQAVPSQAGNAEVNAKSLFDLRAFYPGGLFPETNGYTHTEIVAESSTRKLAYDLADQLRFLVTTTSSGLNLSRNGTQRLSLNNLVYPGGRPTLNGQPIIDALIATIQFHAPNFGQRFYRKVASWTAAEFTPANLNALTVTGDPNTGGPLKDHKLIYLNKLAANIKDYIDNDNQPTVIGQDGKIIKGYFNPLVGFSSTRGGSPVWAIGKEAIPYMDETATRFRTFVPPNSVNKYGLKVDYYIELWNMTGRTIRAGVGDLGPNPRIRIADPTPIVGDVAATQSLQNCTFLEGDEGVSPSQSRDYTLDDGKAPPGDPLIRDLDIDISSVTFYPGRATVITTDPNWRDVITDPILQGDARHPSVVNVCPIKGTGRTVFTGNIPNAKHVTPTKRCTLLRVPITPWTSTKTSDYRTSVVIYNDDGYFDAVEGALPVYNGGSVLTMPVTGTAGVANSTEKKLFGGSLHGNSNTSGRTSMTGDPRTNSEQLDCFPYAQSGEPPDRTRYYNFTWGGASGNSGVGADASFGTPNFNFIKPTDYSGTSLPPWPDCVALDPSRTLIEPNATSSTNTPSVIANAPLNSIGQLGDVYDPSRYVSDTSRDTIAAARGGGRTLKIGQPDDLWDGDSMSASHSWAAWRLADFFCTDDAMLQPGLININGVGRDNGAALRAALSGFVFQKNAPSGRGALGLENTAFTAGADPKVGLNAIVNQIRQRLTQPTDLNGAPGTKYGVQGYEPLNTGRGPFFERGEFSELPIFGRNPPPGSGGTSPYKASGLTGTDMAKVDDRGREEVFRRLVEMTTTRGNVFTVYAMGQAIIQSNPADPKTKRVMSTQRTKVTFRLVPKGSSANKNSDFLPAMEADAQKYDEEHRFKRPDHYDIQILSSSKGGS